MSRRIGIILICFIVLTAAKESDVKPILQRISPQDEVAPAESIIDNCWVAVGSKAHHAIAYDYAVLFEGRPSYRFELKAEDNTLKGHSEGSTKGRAELCYSYASTENVKTITEKQVNNAIAAKKLYYYGKGFCKQADHCRYKFSIFVPSTLSRDVSTIFAQWHGMPDRTLLKTPDGQIKKVSDEEFITLSDKVLFIKDTGYDKIAVVNKNGTPKTDANGNTMYKAGKENGWEVEQGGYPPLAFGFSNGYFYVKANSDRKWMSDNSDRCNINPEDAQILVPHKSKYKTSTIAYKRSFDEFPKDKWVTFEIDVQWASFGGEKESIDKNGKLDVQMSYQRTQKKVSEHIVDNATLLIGRNDEMGYYFKFGIYRVGNSTVPVQYNLAGYEESILKN